MLYVKGKIMKKSLIFLSVLVVAMIAFFDAKDRFAELDSVAANTPSQVEMKQMINKNGVQTKNSIPDFKNTQQQNSESIQDKMNKGRLDNQNQLNNIDKRRDTINNKQ